MKSYDRKILNFSELSHNLDKDFGVLSRGICHHYQIIIKNITIIKYKTLVYVSLYLFVTLFTIKGGCRSEFGQGPSQFKML